MGIWALMPTFYESAEYAARRAMARDRVDLFHRLTREGMSSVQALEVIDEEMPFVTVDDADEDPDAASPRLPP